MKKVVIGFGVLVVVIFCIMLYFTYIFHIDTKYAINYSKVLGSYDINQVDRFLNEDTAITYKDFSQTYKELRVNVINAFKEHNFNINEKSSYGHGNNDFIDGVQFVGIQSYVTIDNKNIEVYIEMQLEKIGFNKFKIKSLSSDNEFFGYLFFGIK